MSQSNGNDVKTCRKNRDFPVYTCIYYIPSPFFDYFAGKEEVGARGNGDVDELVEPDLSAGIEEVEALVVDEVAVVVGVEEASVVLVYDAEDEEDLRIGEVALLLVEVGPELVLDVELEVLEQVARLEELKAPVGGRLELRLVEHGQHAHAAEEQEDGEEDEATLDDEVGQALRYEAVVEDGERVHGGGKALLELLGETGADLAAKGLYVLLVGDDEGGHHGDHDEEVEENADAGEDAEELQRGQLGNEVGEEGGGGGERGDEYAADRVAQRAAHHAHHLLVGEGREAHVRLVELVVGHVDALLGQLVVEARRGDQQLAVGRRRLAAAAERGVLVGRFFATLDRCQKRLRLGGGGGRSGSFGRQRLRVGEAQLDEYGRQELVVVVELVEHIARLFRALSH